jgi:hypothetical protein
MVSISAGHCNGNPDAKEIICKKLIKIFVIASDVSSLEVSLVISMYTMTALPTTITRKPTPKSRRFISCDGHRLQRVPEPERFHRIVPDVRQVPHSLHRIFSLLASTHQFA